MELKTRITLAVGVMFAALLCVIAITTLYIRTHHGPPRSFTFLLLPAVILFAFIVASMIVRSGRPRSETDVTVAFTAHRPWLANAIRAGLVIYVLGLLNGIRLIAEHAIPLGPAIVGLAICMALIVASWRALKRLDKIKAINNSSTQPK